MSKILYVVIPCYNEQEVLHETAKHLREKFLEDFRARFRQQLDNIEIVEPDDPRLEEQKQKNRNN